MASPAPNQRKIPDAVQHELFMLAFSRMDSIALGIAVAIVAGLALSTTTVILVIQGGPNLGETLNLLFNYFPGYQVSFGGVFFGLVYGGALGFAIGWIFAEM